MPAPPTHHKRRSVGLLALLACTLFTGCATIEASAGHGGEDTQTLQVYATTGYLADTLHNLAPEANVITMVGPGGDPHTYQPSTKDIHTMLNADVVFWNGLHLEAQMADQLASLGDAQLAVGDHLPPELLIELPETDDAGNPLYDPHIWNSPTAWSLVVEIVADTLAEVDPDHAHDYRTNADAYLTQIAEAATEAQSLLSEIPATRTLITGHDAFGYFGTSFDLDVHATDFVSSQAQLSPRAISDLADLIATERIPVIFRDNQANPQAITSLTEAVHDRGWHVRISADELFADSLGAAPGVDTYLGAFMHNTRTIAHALGGTPE